MMKQKQKLKIEQIRTFKLIAIHSYEFESSYHIAMSLKVLICSILSICLINYFLDFLL